MRPQESDTVMASISELLCEQGLAGLPELIGKILNAAMQVERSQVLGAMPYERSGERTGYANGFKPKTLKTRMGEIEVAVPQARGISFYPQALEKGVRSEKALKAALAQMYIEGVSTRRVESILEKLCGLEVSASQVSRVTKELDGELEKWRQRPLGEMPYVFLDARYEKVRYEGQVRDLAVLWAIGILPCGRREVLGVSVSLSEAEVHWRSFLKSLKDRGLCGVLLIISDDHAGMKVARKAIFGSVAWQRCQFHLSQNAQSYATSKPQRLEIAGTLKDIFAAPDLQSAKDRLALAVKNYQGKNARFASWMEENIPEGFSIYAFPEHHRKRLRTSNVMERGNLEIKRRTRVARLFPNADACLRLVSAVLAELHEDWATGKIYLDMTDLKTLTKEAATQ